MRITSARGTAGLVLALSAASAVVLQGSPSLAAPVGFDAVPDAARFRTAAVQDVGGLFPGGSAVADFTSDGTPDVAVAVASTQVKPGLVVAVGDGQGGFAERIDTTLPSPFHGCDIATGDLDGDDNADLAVSTCGSGGSPVFLLTGNGDGSFEVSQEIAISALSHPAIGEFNGDGKPDLAVVRHVGGLSVYFGNGNGTVGAPTNYASMNSDTIRAIDVTGDGKIDLSFTGPSTMVNNGAGVFGSPVGADFFASSSTVADLDGDGIPDGAGVDGSGRHVFLAHGSGDGRYHLTSTLTLNVSQTISITGGDFTGDGKGDLVVNGDGQAVYLYAGRGDLTVKKPVIFSTGSQQLRAADLGGSDATDLVSLSEDPGRVYGVMGGKRGLGAAAFVPSQVPGEIALGDVDGDGRTDIVTAGGILPKSGGIWSAIGVDLNRGKERFDRTIVTTVREESAGAGVTALTLADVNDDGKLDAVGGFENFGFAPSNLFVALGRGNGRFKPPLLTHTGDSTTRALAVAVGDVTGDGKLDVISNTKTELSVLPGKGNGTFKAPILSGSAGQQQTQTLLGDVTGDGVTDVVATLITGTPEVSKADLLVERGDGTGHFTEVQRTVVDSNVRGAVLADLSGDSRLDLAVDGHGGTNGGRSGLYVLINTASGTLKAPVYYASGGNSLVGGDFNQDGSIDLATDGPGGGTAIDLNKGNGEFFIGDWIVTPSGPAYAGDVTGDGVPEIFSYPSATQAAIGMAVNLTPRS